MEPREFFIEDRLEKYRLEAPCNLGESGIRNISLGELLQALEIPARELEKISLTDSANNGSYALRKEIAALYPGISPEQVLVTTGTSEALYLFFQLALEKGSRVSLVWPAFQALYEIPAMLGAKVVKTENFQELFGDNPDVVMINHPHNPTGKKLSAGDIAFLQQKSHDYSGYMLFDEHYRFLDYENDLGYSGAGLTAKSFATGSVTKCFGVTGLRTGWLIGEPEFLKRARSYKDYLTHTVNPVSEFLVTEILKNRKQLIAPVKKRIQTNLEYFSTKIKSIHSFQYYNPPQGGLVAFPELCDGIESAKYCDLLYKNCGVFTLPGSTFEKEGFIRISFGEEEKRFRDGIDRWVEWETGLNNYSLTILFE